MAERRMFAKTIIDSDIFLDMPMSARLLYYDLCMRADDDGFINNPKRITRLTGASDDDLKLLVAKQFIIPFETGIVVIRHWKIHNYIRNDRYKETIYKQEKELLNIGNDNAYELGIPNDIPNGYQMDTQVRLGKDRLELGKDSIGKVSGEKKKKTPTLDELINQDDRLSKTIKETVRTWLAYKQEKSETYKTVGFKALLTEIANKITLYGEDAVINVIQLSMANNWKGIIWDKLIKQNKKSKDRMSVVTDWLASKEQEEGGDVFDL